MESVQNATARLITHSKKHDHITPIFKELHSWLPVEERIIFKNLLLVKKVLSNEAPLYLSDFVEFYVPGRTNFRSTKSNVLILKRKDVRIMDGEILEFLLLFIRPSFDGSIMVWCCPSIRSVVHNPCGQDIARTIWPRMLKLSVYTLYGQSKKPIYFQGQRSNFKVTGPLRRILALGSLWAGYSKNYTNPGASRDLYRMSRTKGLTI